jgi:hypothetical protein
MARHHGQRMMSWSMSAYLGGLARKMVRVKGRSRSQTGQTHWFPRHGTGMRLAPASMRARSPTSMSGGRWLAGDDFGLLIWLGWLLYEPYAQAACQRKEGLGRIGAHARLVGPSMPFSRSSGMLLVVATRLGW